MLDEDQAAELTGQTLLDEDGEEVGPIEEVFVLPADDKPAFAAVAVGGRRVVVPLDDAELGDAQVTVRYDLATIEGAPEADADAIDPDLEEAVYGHYGISDATIRDDTGFSASEPAARDQGTSRDPRGGGGADDAAQGHP
jgi:hypothetical protein